MGILGISVHVDSKRFQKLQRVLKGYQGVTRFEVSSAYPLPVGQ